MHAGGGQHAWRNTCPKPRRASRRPPHSDGVVGTWATASSAHHSRGRSNEAVCGSGCLAGDHERVRRRRGRSDRLEAQCLSEPAALIPVMERSTASSCGSGLRPGLCSSLTGHHLHVLRRLLLPARTIAAGPCSAESCASAEELLAELVARALRSPAAVAKILADDAGSAFV